MIDCLEKQLQNHQLQLMTSGQQSTLNHHHHQRPIPNHRDPPPYQATAINMATPMAAIDAGHFHATSYQQQQQQQKMPHQQLQVQVQERHRSMMEVPTAVATAAAAANHQQSGNELIGYYFGSISRETAEWVLKTHGNNMDGAYLLRSSGPNDDFVLSLMVIHTLPTTAIAGPTNLVPLSGAASTAEVLHYKIVETEDSFVALHGQVKDEKFATIDELIDKAQGVATKPRWPIRRQSLESQILPPTYWGLTVDQVRLAILIKAKQWGFPLLSSLFQQQDQVQQLANFNALTKNQQPDQQLHNSSVDNCPQLATNEINVTTLNNETIRTLIYKSLHEFQPWFHGKISREEAERRIEENTSRDGRFLVRERDNYSYAMCICHKKTTKHYRIDVLPTGELAIQDGRKFTSLMALVSHYTIMSDGLWCALTEACPRPINDGTRNGCCDAGSSSSSGLNNNGAFGPGPQARVPLQSNYRYANNNSAAMLQQNFYCVPPTNSATNTTSNNAINNLILPGPINNLALEGKENHQINLHSHQNSNNANLTSDGSSGCKSQSTLMCSHQGGVVSIKAPIREWLQTINHKWSQLIASQKNQHQSLNSFLFGNQNPLNNHCKYNRRDPGHLMNHRHRKCKNGHASCACIRQQMLANRAALAATAQNLPDATGSSLHQLAKLNETDSAQLSFCRYQKEGVSAEQVHSCCPVSSASCPSNSTTLCPTTAANKSQCAIGPMPNNFIKQINPAFLENQPNNMNLSSNTLLSRLPLNSGFTLSSQSFIGSPLFAVKQAQSEKNKLLVGSGSLGGSSSSNSGNSNIVEEERLISPVQSVSGNLNNNNPYNFDIYGSQTSTAVVNDQLPATSSSSSSETNRLMLGRGLDSNNNGLKNKTMYGTTTNGARNQNNHMVAQAAQQQVPANYAGPILCGQHAGPAFRYTNCTDENNYKPCFHRPQAPCRAADDSQLATTSTQLACPAAMSKFVQFQDGQCLRTHRDTRSIQMAYLSSRPNNNGLHQNHRQSTNGHQLPLRELNAHRETNGQSNFANNKSNNWNRTQYNPTGCNGPELHHANVPGTFNASFRTQFRRADGQSTYHEKSSTRAQENNTKLLGIEVDLMDCGEEDNFDFKYDPKLIKSSSIETLCGFGGGEENFDDQINCKSNTELVLSLQSCWVASQQPTNILKPIQSNDHNTASDSAQLDLYATEDLIQDDTNINEGSILSSLIVESKQNEQLDSMKKKHDADELTTNLLAELTASLKAQVDLKNKRSGFNSNNNINSNNMKRPEIQTQQGSGKQQHHHTREENSTKEEPVSAELDPLELINEFDTLIPNNR